MPSIVAVDLLERVVGALLPAPVRSSGLMLIAANLLPLYGVLFWDWPVFHLMALYWAENVIAGLVTVLRMVHANPLAGVPMGAFFCFHYGMFCFVHGMFVHALFSGEHAMDRGVWALVGILLTTPSLLAAVALMLASHGWSFVAHTLLAPRDGALDNVRRIMMRPYGRMVVLHVTILGGGFLSASLGSPAAVLVPLIVFKIVADLFLHRRANVRPLEPVLPPAVPPTVSSVAPPGPRPRPYEIP